MNNRWQEDIYTMIISDEYAEQLARKLHEKRLILFAGAGLSLQAVNTQSPSKKLPLWWSLAEDVSKKFSMSVDDFRGEILDLFDAISVSRSRRELEDAVREAIPDHEYNPGPAHIELSKLPWKRIYTTNYDDLLKRALGEKLSITSEKSFELLTRAPEEQPKLIHLHGDLSDMHTLTGEDYSNWKARHPNAQNRFTVDGVECSFLFVGYSNSDPHFRHQILPLIKELKSTRGHRNYSWMWQPTSAQSKLFSTRDMLDVHSIDDDGEWIKCFETLVQAYEDVSKTPADKKRQKRHSRLFTSGKEANEWHYINGYKLFYHRDYRSISRERLAGKSKISVSRIRALETVDRRQDYGEKCFKRASSFEIWNLERALRPQTSLEYGRGDDDFLAFYLDYYKNNWKKKRAKFAPQQAGLFNQTRAVVFDFGGTLTLPKYRRNTWERIWQAAGYDLQPAHELHHRFSTGKITHQEWCDLTLEKLRAGGFTRSKFEELYEDVEIVTGVEETFKKLRERNIEIHIVSGSLRDIIQNALGAASSYVDTIRSNDFAFDKNGLIEFIKGHPFDFEGKAHFITKLSKEIGCHPIEVLFVGNSLNDEKAATSGARTLCVNPKHTHFYEESMWNNTLREMKDLNEVLKFV